MMVSRYCIQVFGSYQISILPKCVVLLAGIIHVPFRLVLADTCATDTVLGLKYSVEYLEGY
jgi:hypothetical protein